MSQRKVLFLCTGNSCRSQMAEAIVNARLGDAWAAYSAGTQPAGYVHPLALQVLAEIGIEHQGRSKSADEYRQMSFDLVVTVCDDAAENCPVWLGRGGAYTWAFPIRPRLTGTDEEVLAIFRSVRDDIARVHPGISHAIFRSVIMTDLVLSDIAIAPPEVVRHATRDLAAALAEAPAFTAYEQAAAAFRQDEAAQRAVQAYQLKQQSLQMMLMLNAVSPEDRAELNRLVSGLRHSTHGAGLCPGRGGSARGVPGGGRPALAADRLRFRLRVRIGLLLGGTP